MTTMTRIRRRDAIAVLAATTASAAAPRLA
jgi:hypothetical protein